MEFVGWLIVIALGYVAVGGWLFVLVDCVSRRAWASLLFLPVGPVVAWLCLSAASRWHGPIYYIQNPQIEAACYAGVFVAALFVCVAIEKRLMLAKQEWQDRKRRKELSRQIKLHLALVTGAILFSVPFYWMITTSLKPDDRVNLFPPDLIPKEQELAKIGGEARKVYWLRLDGADVRVAKMAELENDRWRVRVVGPESQTPDHRVLTVPRKRLRDVVHPTARWSNYSEALAFLPPEYHKGLRPLWNTVYITILVIAGTVFASSLVAFSFARLKWPGRDLLFIILLATMMVPAAVTMLPVFLIFRSLNWIDTLRPLWVPAFFGSPFSIFLLRQFFMTIPNDLEDAAKIDGCGYFTIYRKIMLPLIKPALAAITIFAFMGSWNNFMGPLIYINSPENMPLSYALQLFQGAHGGEPAMMMAAATLVMLPVLIVFFITQRYMIQGVTLTGIKG